LDDDEKLRTQFNYLKSKGEVWEMEEDEELQRIQLLREIEDNNSGLNKNDWKDIVGKELNIFTKKEYNFSKDLK